MALFKISKGLAANLAKNVPNAKEGFAYFTSDDGKFYIDTAGDGTTATPAVVGTNRIPLNAYASDVLKAGEMSTTDGVVYPILAFKITDTAKNLVEAKYGKIGFKNGTLVIPNLQDHDEMYITNEGDGRALVIEKLKGTTIGNKPGPGIEIKSETNTYAIEVTGKSKGIKVTQDPTDDLELTTKQYVDTSVASKQDKITADGILKGDGEGNITAADNIEVSLVSIDKSTVDLGNVDNTSDLNKPISTATQTALDNKADKSALNNYLPLVGGTLTGNLILNKTDTSDIYCRVNNSNNTIGIVASTNGGLYDFKNSKWIVYHNTSNNLNYFDNYCITTKGARGLPVIAQDYGSMGIGSQLNFFQTGAETPYNGSILCNSSWNFLGKNRLYLQGTTTTAADLPTLLSLSSKDTDTGITDYSYIATYSGHNSGSYGGTMVINGGQALVIGGGESASNCYANILKNKNTEDTYITADAEIYFYTNCNTWANHTEAVKIDTAGKLWGAVWNDYAEMREGDTIEAGKCVVEVGDDTLKLSSERMQPGANITSDTFGFAIGETDKCKTPIAVSGRVLAYGYEDREDFRKNIGRPVCSGPNGTVSIMTDEEYKEKGYCAIGTISAVPDYEEWGTGNVKVDGRIWIKVI